MRTLEQQCVCFYMADSHAWALLAAHWGNDPERKTNTGRQKFWRWCSSDALAPDTLMKITRFSGVFLVFFVRN